MLMFLWLRYFRYLICIANDDESILLSSSWGLIMFEFAYRNPTIACCRSSRHGNDFRRSIQNYRLVSAGIRSISEWPTALWKQHSLIFFQDSFNQRGFASAHRQNFELNFHFACWTTFSVRLVSHYSLTIIIEMLKSAKNKIETASLIIFLKLPVIALS